MTVRHLEGVLTAALLPHSKQLLTGAAQQLAVRQLAGTCAHLPELGGPPALQPKAQTALGSDEPAVQQSAS